MADALADVLVEQKEKVQRRKEATPKPERRTSPVVWVALILLSAVSGYIWFGSPAWLNADPDPVPPPLAEAGLRMEIFYQAVLVEDFLESEGRLPNDLAEAGEPLSEVDYEKIDARTYRLALAGLGEASDVVVEYISTDSLEAFLGDAPQIIRMGG
ncbi:MAG: hypothetical protein HKO65_02295 [Gemmatimonadetes bacterium]|nr:hypothetical protein [Gemmatimonadota bacterium]NNM03907.1 hypothetical protein [Gemmatimonadota bacterium]